MGDDLSYRRSCGQRAHRSSSVGSMGEDLQQAEGSLGERGVVWGGSSKLRVLTAVVGVVLVHPSFSQYA